MKKGLLICLMYCLGGVTLTAQNDLFLGFPYAYHHAYAYLDSLDYVRIETQVPERRLITSIHGAHYRYDFLGGWLYRVTMIRHFPNRRQARKAYRSVRDYFGTTGTETWAETRSHYVGAGAAQLFELILRPGTGRHYALHLSARHPLFTPLPEWTPYDVRMAQTLSHP